MYGVERCPSLGGSKCIVWNQLGASDMSAVQSTVQSTVQSAGQSAVQSAGQSALQSTFEGSAIKDFTA